jgi:hypothetical protein
MAVSLGLFAAVVALAPPRSEFYELEDLGPRPTVFAGEQLGAFVPSPDIDPRATILGPTVDLDIHVRIPGAAFAGDPHILLSRPDPVQRAFVDTVLSGIARLFGASST